MQKQSQIDPKPSKYFLPSLDRLFHLTLSPQTILYLYSACSTSILNPFLIFHDEETKGQNCSDHRCHKSSEMNMN